MKGDGELSVGAELTASKIQDATHLYSERKPRSVLKAGGTTALSELTWNGVYKLYA